MSENIGINLQAGLNVSQSTIIIKQQVQKVQDLLKPLNIKINSDTLVKEFDKVSTSIKVATDGTSRIQKNIINIATEEGKLVQITQAYNKEINAMAVSGIKIVDNLKAQANEAKKVTEAVKKSQQTISDTARKMSVDEENKRISTVTEAQKRIEQRILGSNQTISEQQKRMNSVNANNYEQVWLKAFQRVEAEELRLANMMGRMNEQSQARVSSQNNRSDLAQNTAINNASDSAYVQAQRDEQSRLRARQEASDTARRMMADEENQRVATTTNAQRRIEQAILGSNETITQQQARMNSSQANGYRYEQMFLQASRERGALDTRNAELESQRLIASTRNLQAERQQTAELQRQVALYQEQNAIQLRNLQSQYGSLARTPEIQSQISAIRGTVGGLSSSVLDANGFRTQSAQINTAISGIRASLNEARTASDNFGNDLVKNGIKMLQWGVIGGILFGTLRQIKEGFSFINDLDKAMTNISMITGESRNSIVEMTKAYADLATQLHTTTGEAMKSAEEFLRAGHNQEETLKLIQSATVMGAIAGQDSKSSADQLIAITNGFKMSADQAIDVVDKLTTVDNMSATSTKELGTALERTSVSAQMAGTSFSELVSYIGTVSSISRKSASSIGESFKTIFSRFQDVRGGKNFDAENQDISNVERDFKKYADISIRETSGEFKDFSIVINELSSKWNTLSEVAQSAASKALAGTRQRENFLILMNNMDTALKLQSAQLDSSGSSMTRYGEFAKSTEAKLNDLTNAVQKIWLNLLSSEAINSAIEGMTKFVGVIDNATSIFGGFNTALYLVIATLSIFKGQAIAGAIAALGKFALANGIAATATKGFAVALEFLNANPIILALTAVAAITAGLVHYANQQAKVKEQLEATVVAQESFNSILKDFQNTLDPKKIDELSTSLEKLKQSSNYDETIKKIQTLKDEIAGLQESEVEQGADWTKTIASKTKEIETLTASIKPYTDAQSKYNEQQKIATALDYESVQAGNKKIALKIRENESNRQLIDSYQKVHDKIAQGNELTQEESNLNQKMIDKYPEYTKVLNDKTTAVGLDIDALKLNQTAEEALAIVSFNAMKTKAESSALATKQIIADTEARIRAIQAEIDALQGKNEAMGSANANIQYQKLLEQGSAQTFMEFKNGTIFNDTITPKLKIDLSSAWKQLQTAKQTLGAWNTLSNMSIDDLKKGVSDSSGNSFDPPSSDKDKDKKELSIESITQALLDQIEAEHLLTKTQSDKISKELEQAKSAKDYTLILEKQNELISNQAKELSQLQSARDKINSLKDSALSSSKFGDINRWYTGQDNKESVTFVQEKNAQSEEVRKAMDEEFKSSQILRNGWMSVTKAIEENIEKSREFAKQSREDLIKSLEEQSSLLSSKETTSLESSFKNLDIESWIKKNVSTTKTWAETISELQEELAKLGNPTTLEGQKKFNELMVQSAKLAADAKKAQDEYAKSVDKMRQEKLFESTDANLQAIMDEIDSIDQQQQLSKGGISSAVPKIDMEIIPRIDYKSVEEAIEEIPKPNEDLYSYKPPLSFVEFINNEFTNAVSLANNNISQLKSKITALGAVTPENKDQILSYYQQIQNQVQILADVAKNAQDSLKLKLDSGEISQDDFNNKMQAIQTASIEVLAIPKIEITAEATQGIQTLQDQMKDIVVDADTKLADDKLLALISKQYETIITINADDIAATQSILMLQQPTSSIHTIYVQTVEGEKPEGYAKGTKNHPGGLAYVDDELGGKRELIVLPNGSIMLGDNSGPKLVNLPKGTEVIPNDETERILKSNNGKIPAYADGTGSHITDIDFLNDSLEEFAQSISDVSKEIAKTTKIVAKDNTAVEKSDKKIAGYEKTLSKYLNEDGSYKDKYVGSRSAERAVDRTQKNIDKETIKNEQLVTKAESDQAILDGQKASKTDFTQKLIATQKALANLNSAQYIEQKIDLYQEAITVASANIDELYDSIAKYKNDDGTYEDNETTREVLGKIKSNFEASKSAQLSIKQLVKERFEAEYEGFDKAQEKAEAQVSYLQKTLEYQKLIGASIEDQLATEQAIQEENQTKVDSLQAEKTQLETDLAEAEASVKADLAKVDPNYTDADLANALANSQEFNQASDKLDEVNGKIIDANITIKQTAQEIEKIKFDKLVKPFDDAISRLEVLLKLLDETDFAGSIENIESQMAETASKIETIKQQIATEMARTDITAGEKATNVAKYTTDLENAELAMKGLIDAEKDFQNKALAQTFKTQYEAIEKTLFNGSTEQEAQDALNQRIKLQEKYLSGAEKDLEISKIRTQIQSEGLTLTAEQTALLNTQGDIEKSSIERLQKQLDIQQLQLKVKNLMENESIQQLTKNADGTWDFAYVADQEAIASAQEELANSQVDLINWEQDEINEADQEKLDEKSKYLARVKTIMDRALNGEYASFEDFQRDMTNLNREYMGNMDLINSTEWNNIFTSTQTNLDSIESAYSTYVTNLEALAVRAEQALQEILNAQAAAQAANEAAENETATTPTTPETTTPETPTTTTTTTTIELERDPNGPSTKVVKVKTGSYAEGGETQKTGWHFLDGKTGSPERVLTSEQTASFNRLVDMLPTLDITKIMNDSVLKIRNMADIFKPVDLVRNISGLLKQTPQVTQQIFNIDKLEFPNIKDGSNVESLINGLTSYAIQYSKK